MQEIELKFLIPESRLKGMMRQIDVKAAKHTPMRAHYFDTPDQQLAQSGIGLRIRQEGDTWVQTIKAGGAGVVARTEHNAVLDSEQVEAMIAADTLSPNLKMYKHTDIAPALAPFKRKKLEKALVCQYLTDIERTTRVLKDGHNSIELAYDTGAIIHGQAREQRTQIHEVEFELLSGTPAYLFSTAKKWCKRYKLCLSTVTKAERGSLLLKEKAHSKATHVSISTLDIANDWSVPAYVQALIQHTLLQILPNSSAIVEGSLATEHSWQLYLGLRRLQAIYRAYQPLWSALSNDALPVIIQTANILKEYHDATVLRDDIEPQMSARGAPATDWQAHIDAISITPIDAIEANDFQCLLLDMLALSMQAIDADTEDACPPLQDAIASALDSQYAKVKEHLTPLLEWDTANDGSAETLAQYQDSASALLNLYYLSAFAAPCLPKKAKRWQKTIKKSNKHMQRYLQRLEQQHAYRNFADEQPDALFAAGWLLADLPSSAHKWHKHSTALLDQERT
ncbi:CYTH and CHAD domain-containing protein [Psychrobacter aestuarii]|uniref:CYTH and CHAD domain-containing protein n=1 Tax=Psychrobacter aestuarii TaxID=556327 RepID=A0ABN0VLW3_9GAMM|nr:CYTH and CHAD domain-containing protein [Psychrobacter aestuarii]